MVDFRVVLYDGSYHDVDSSELAFKLAARKAFKKMCIRDSLLAAARMALMSKACLAASVSRARRTSSTMGSLDMAYFPNSSSGVQITGIRIRVPGK